MLFCTSSSRHSRSAVPWAVRGVHALGCAASAVLHEGFRCMGKFGARSTQVSAGLIHWSV